MKLFLLRLALICALCMPVQAAWAADDHTERLTIGVSQFPPNLNPNIDATVAKSYILGFTHRNFTVHDANWDLTCLICTELPSFENGRAVIITDEETGTRRIDATYTIEDGASWGDGTPMTTEDVLFTWRAMSDLRTGGANLELFAEDIMDITVEDAQTFTLHFDKENCDFAAINDFRLLPAHLEETIWEEDPETYRRRTLYQQAPQTPGLWSGPYMITEVEQGAYVVLGRNPHWWGELPVFDEIVIRTVENSASLTANLLAGEIDMIAGELGVLLDQAIAFERGHGDDWQIIYKDGLIYEHIDFNLDNPILADERVRRALMLGIDRDMLSRELFAGRQSVAYGNISPLDHEAHDPDLPQPDYDQPAAARLLSEAGWVKRGQWRSNAAGQRLAIDFVTTSGNRTRELVQQFLVAQWRQLGVEVRVNNQPPRVMFGETMTERTFSGMAMYAWISSPGNIPRSTLHSEEIPNEANGWSGQNYPGWKREDVDEMLEALETACTPEESRPLWSGIQQAYSSDVPVLPLYWRADAFILPPWLTGVEPTGHMHPTSLWVENWGITEEE